MAAMIYQVQIALKGFNPKIWRRILIPSDMLLVDFHKVIQSSMGWTNSHLHQFIKDRTFYSIKHPGDDMWDDMDNIDYKKKKLRISDLLKTEHEQIIYEYDFGDGWEHEIILEAILPKDSSVKYPVCLTGKMSCPPEDCGGIRGYTDMLEILKNPGHEEYAEYIEWLGKKFDPKYFNKDEVNKLLQEKNYGCFAF